MFPHRIMCVVDKHPSSSTPAPPFPPTQPPIPNMWASDNLLKVDYRIFSHVCLVGTLPVDASSNEPIFFFVSGIRKRKLLSVQPVKKFVQKKSWRDGSLNSLHMKKSPHFQGKKKSVTVECCFLWFCTRFFSLCCSCSFPILSLLLLFQISIGFLRGFCGGRLQHCGLKNFLKTKEKKRKRNSPLIMHAVRTHKHTHGTF